MLEDSKLIPYMSGFYGYGNPQAPVWFIGMEEGGGNNEAEIQARLDAWEALGHPEFADLYQFHQRIGITQFFEGDKPKIQKTWKRLCGYHLSLSSPTFDTESLRTFQATQLGRYNSETCLLELLPLPSSSLNDWIYAEITNNPWLVTRSKYKKHLMPIRQHRIRQLIQQHKPRRVVFYGSSYRNYWMEIAGSRDWSEDGFAKYTQVNGVEYEIYPHPTHRIVTDQKFTAKRSLLRVK